MKIGQKIYTDGQFSQFLHRQNVTCLDNLKVFGRRIFCFLTSKKWLDSRTVFQILLKSQTSSHQIRLIFKNSKISPSLLQKIKNLSHQAPSCPAILIQFLQKKGNRTHYNPQGRSIQERRPQLFAFLTDPHMKYTTENYDFGIEDEFGVMWIDPNKTEDADFIRNFEKKYRSSLPLPFTFATATQSAPLSMKAVTRFANNDIYAFLVKGLKQIIFKEMIRDIIIWNATRQVCQSQNMRFPHQEVIRYVFET